LPNQKGSSLIAGERQKPPILDKQPAIFYSGGFSYFDSGSSFLYFWTKLNEYGKMYQSYTVLTIAGEVSP
jgi:hypothetical protein